MGGKENKIKIFCTFKKKLFFFLYVQDSFGFFVIRLDHNRVGYPVEDPQFCIGHREPPDKAVKREEERFSDTFDSCSTIVDLCSVTVDHFSVHHHFADGLAPESFHHRPVQEEEDGLKTNCKDLPAVIIPYEGQSPEWFEDTANDI